MNVERELCWSEPGEIRDAVNLGFGFVVDDGLSVAMFVRFLVR